METEKGEKKKGRVSLGMNKNEVYGLVQHTALHTVIFLSIPISVVLYGVLKLKELQLFNILKKF